MLAMKQSDGMTISCIDSGWAPSRVEIPKSPVMIDRAPIVRLLNIFFWKLGMYSMSPTAG